MKKKNKLNKRKIFLSIILLILIIGPTTYYWYNETRSYEINIIRNYKDDNELKAINAAENIDYSSLFNISRFDYNWANFIDSQVIEHYENQVKEKQKNKNPVFIGLEYRANAMTLDRCLINYDNKSCEITIIYNSSILVKDNYPKRYGESCLLIFNGSSLNVYRDIDIVTEYGIHRTYEMPRYYSNEYNHCYFIEMNCDFGCTEGPLDGQYSFTCQYIVLDMNFNLIFAFLDLPTHWVS